MVHSVQVAGNTGCLYLMGNCIPYYEIREREWILMDCGSRLARTQLAEYLSKNKISVRAVLCSHGHYDHTENNRFLQEEYGAELVMSCLDAGILQDTLSLKTVFYSNTLQIFPSVSLTNSQSLTSLFPHEWSGLNGLIVTSKCTCGFPSPLS